MIEWIKITDETEFPHKDIIVRFPDMKGVKEIFWCPNSQHYWYYETCCREYEMRMTVEEIKEYSYFSEINPPKE